MAGHKVDAVCIFFLASLYAGYYSSKIVFSCQVFCSMNSFLVHLSFCRLAIERALLRKSRIMLFDAPASSLDTFAQDCMMQCIDNMKGSSAIAIVAHRLSTIKNVDKIYFLYEGKIIDSGTFKKYLIRIKNLKGSCLSKKFKPN